MIYTKAILDADSLFNPSVPRSWKKILEMVLTMENILKSKDDENAEDLQPLQQEILASSALLLEAEQLHSFENGETERTFLKALNLLTILQRAIEGSSGIFDTSRSKTLRHHKTDRAGLDRLDSHKLAQLIIDLGLKERDKKAIEDHTKSRLEYVEKREAIIRELRTIFKLNSQPNNFDANLFAFFDAFFPDTGLLPGEVEVVIAGNLICFCIPFEGQDLVTERYQSMTAEEKLPIKSFLRKVTGFQQSYFSHFPAFGFFDARSLPDDLVAELSLRLNLAREDLLDELKKMVMILPADEVDRFIVHDLWGHGWQGSLFSFQEGYQGIAAFPRSIRPQARTVSRQGKSLALRDCFAGSGDNFKLKPKRFTAYIRAEIDERIPIVMTPVLAELLADYIEFKFLSDNPELSDDLGSSSRFKFQPVKIDFLLKDLPFYFAQATKAFRTLSLEASRQQALVDDLIAEGASPASARQVVSEMIALWDDLHQSTYSAEFLYEEKGEELKINVLTLLTLNFLAIHRAVISLDSDLEAYDSKAFHLRSWRELIAFNVAAFFEENRRENLWRIDEYLTLKLKDLCLQLTQISE